MSSVTNIGPCDCCGGVPCSECSGLPEIWEITVVGVTNNIGGFPCALCGGYNGTFDLIYNGGVTCSWETADPAICFDPANPLYFFGVGLTHWALSTSFESSTVLRWELAKGSFDCDGANILSLAGTGSTKCSNWPATVTITPA